MKKFALTLLTLSTLLFSCKKDKEDDNLKDTQKPLFTALTIEGENVLNAAEEIEVHLGEAFDFEVKVSDDVELSELNVSIHSAFDTHNHARLSAEIGADTLSWGPIIRSLAGKEGTQSFSVFSETDTNFVLGEYHLEMILLDKAGNRTERIVAFHLEEEGEEHIH